MHGFTSIELHSTECIKTLVSLRKKFVYAPHPAPLERATGHRLRYRPYPFPMPVEKERCIQRIKVAYRLELYGNHPSVLDGSAGAMFHPQANTDDRLSGGQKKPGKRRRNEQGDGRPWKGQETSSLAQMSTWALDGAEEIGGDGHTTDTSVVFLSLFSQ